MGSGSGRVKTKTQIKLAFIASLLSTKFQRVRVTIGCLGIRKMCQTGATCMYLPTNWVYFQLHLYIQQTIYNQWFQMSSISVIFTTTGPMRGGFSRYIVRGPERQEGACEFLKGSICLSHRRCFILIFSYLFLVYFQLLLVYIELDVSERHECPRCEY